MWIFDSGYWFLQKALTSWLEYEFGFRPFHGACIGISINLSASELQIEGAEWVWSFYCFDFHYFEKRITIIQPVEGQIPIIFSNLPDIQQLNCLRIFSRFLKKKPIPYKRHYCLLYFNIFWLYSVLISSGELGIRTPGGMTLNSFQDCRNRPLCQLSAAKVHLP